MQASRVSRKGVLHCDDSESNNLRCFVIGFPQIAASFSGLSAPRRNEASGRIAAAPVSLRPHLQESRRQHSRRSDLRCGDVVWWLFLGYQTGCTSRTRGNGATFSLSQRGPAQLRRAIRAHGATWHRRASQTVGCARGSTVCAFGASRNEWTSRLERNLQRLWVLGQQR